MAATEDVTDLLADRIVALALSLAAHRRPVLVGLDGPVAVGKSTFARALAEALRGRGLTVAVVGADGFQWPAATLEALGLMRRKGIPAAFDREAMAAFLAGVRAGAQRSAPSYAHAAYDVSQQVRQPTEGAAVVIFEGVNVLAEDLRPLYDLALYLDADPADVEAWFLDRFAATPFGEARAAALAPWRPDDGDPVAWGRAVWAAVNAPNWREHIAGGRGRADLVVRKAADHVLTLS
jgi:type I pantothenate kinase